MASWEPVDEINFENEYDNVDPIDDYNLDESINKLMNLYENKKN